MKSVSGSISGDRPHEGGQRGPEAGVLRDPGGRIRVPGLSGFRGRECGQESGRKRVRIRRVPLRLRLDRDDVRKLALHLQGREIQLSPEIG